LKKSFSLVIIIFALTSICQIKAQKFTFFPLGDEFNYGLEMSSMDIVNDTLYALAEKCKTLYQFDINNLDSSKTNLPIQKNTLKIDKKLGVEAIAVFEDYLFYTNEVNGNSIAAIDLKNFKSIPFLELDKPLPKGNDHNSGLEGIDIIPDFKLLYVAQEKESSGRYSKIAVYHIGSIRDSIDLNFFTDIKIQISDRQRLTALSLSNDNKYLYILRSYYNGKSEATYSVDRLELNQDGSFSSNTLSSSTLSTINLTNDKSKFQSENLEGIAISNNSIYLISDNAQSKVGLCNETLNNGTKILPTQFFKLDNYLFNFR